jgi:hypothetical protein
MYVIPEFHFCFLASPRTASKAIAKMLTEYRGAILIGSHHSIPSDNLEYEIDRSWTICSAIRNHWDTMISWWFKIERRGTMIPLAKFLPRFCRNNPNFVQNRKLWWANWSYTNTLIRYECLQTDFDQALVKAGMAPLDITVRVEDSRRNKAPYQRFYKSDTSEWVGAYFADEIKKCGYKF